MAKSGACPAANFIARYLKHTRSLAVSFLFILPLLVAYEVGMFILQPPAASWAGDAIRWLLHGAFGRWGGLAFNLGVIIAIVASLLATRRSLGAQLDFFPAVLVESLAYGIVVMQVVPLVVHYALPLAQVAADGPGGVMDDVVLSLGAGIYEEIVFRLGLMSAVYFVVTRLTKEHWLAVAAAIMVSSVVFSGCHYLNGIVMPASEFIRSFGYRTLCGIFFAGLYIYRGLAVACYAHAFYDIMVTVFP